MKQELNPIDKNAILIAEFLGSKYINDAPEDYPNGYYYKPQGIEYDCPTGQPNEWCFDTSWDWLMQVVDKIEDSGYYVNVYNRYPRYRCEIENKYNEIIHTTNDSRMECVYDAVINFIKWWNLKEIL